MALEAPMQQLVTDYLIYNSELSKELLNLVRFGANSKRITAVAQALEVQQNQLKKVMEVMPRPSIKYMVDIAEEWFKESTERDQEEFITTKFENLVVFMNPLGVNLINYFGLWNYRWEPVVKDGVDYSEEHPEAVALKIIQELWRKVSYVA
jgi:hypothetical protein